MLNSYQDALCLLPEGIDKFDAFRLIVSSCPVFDVLPNKDVFLDAVVAREKIQSTGVGHGVAIAHGKLDSIDKTYIALGYSMKGISYDDIFPTPVQLLFMIASSEDNQEHYIRAVSSLLSWVHDSEFRIALLSSRFDARPCKEFFSMMKSQEFYPLRIHPANPL